MLKKLVVAAAVLVAVAAVAGAVLVRHLLRAADAVDDYAAYVHNDTAPLAKGDVSVTFIGVSTLLFDDGVTQVLVDGFFTRPTKAQYLSKMASDPAQVDAFFGDFPMDRVRAVLVAHSHVDHALDVPDVARRTGAMVYGTSSTLNIARGGDVPESQLTEVHDGDTATAGAFTVRFVESPHSDPPGVAHSGEVPTIDAPLEQPATNAQFAEGGSFDFVITHGEHTYVVVPSANYRVGALDGVDADVLFLATTFLGVKDRSFTDAYLDQTMGATRPEVVVPLHWDDFLRPWTRGRAQFNPRLIGDTEPARGFDRVIERAEQTGARFTLLQAGSRLVVAG